MDEILTPISPGELLDKLTILTIKLENITDANKRANVHVEHTLLSKVANDGIPKSDQIAKLQANLLSVNKQLWDIEDDIRDCERAGDFGPEFIWLARAVYVTNDKRADLKNRLTPRSALKS
jgi:hypothetical protein